MAQRIAARMDNRVAVVGAGYAGMAAAVTLAGRGVPVTVFESGPVPGGRARRVRISSDGQDTELDNGQHILVGAYSELFRLMRAVGVPEDAVLRLPLEIRYFGGFRFRELRLPYPFGLLGGLLLAKRVPFSDRLNAVRFMAAMQRARFKLQEDFPVEALLQKYRQSGAIGHYLWRPLCVSALNTPAAEASAAAFLVVLRDALCGAPQASDLLLPRVDLSRLFPEPAARFVEAKDGEVRYGSTVRDLAELKKSFKKIIVAVGPHQLKTLMPEVSHDYSYQPIYTCYLQYPETTKLPFPMIGLADGLVQWVFDRGALSEEKGRLACVISAQGDHQQLSLDEIADLCHGELAGAMPGLPRPLWSRVIAEKRATIACVPGVKRPASGTNLPDVWLAGDYTDPEYPPTLEAAVRSGVRAASLING
jgi:squalene-associated FAD-dependent desaturase